ncbi:apolipoprotein N-acyltransferase [Actinobacillus lignieresii]|uniref:Apolipoprotein N-acyltransferase n=1 Tax=Actinobacillus lignieresii TaxID=720 RepID=A0A380TXX3_ACTLI|nr:apolipoprotein N-acyltransferase [Actinobacillus lignieresii]SUT92902.1 apolipoprotein N-acyltransferase [Actinobacillus lignieresii]
MNFVKNPSILTACLLAFALGGLGTLAYSPFDLWGIVYLSAAGLIWAATLPQRKIALWATFAWSLGCFCIGVNWVHVSMTQFGGVPLVVSYIAVFLLACYLALYNLLFSYIAHKFRIQNPFALAAIFTFTEYLRGVVFTGFPWLQFGYTQIDSPFAGIAPLLGVEGLTFFVMTVSGYLALLVKKSAKTTASLATLAILCGLAFAAKFILFVQIDEQKQPLTVSLVQGNIEQKMKWDPAHFDYTLQTYQRLISPLLGKSDVIVLPESAVPALETQIYPLLNQLQQVAADKGSEVIIGTLYQDESEQLFNSAVVLGNLLQPYDLHNTERYNKHHLVPFGEYVPFGSVLDWMRDVFILPINLSQGEFVQPALFAKNRKFNMAICYEVIFGNQMQQNQQAQQSDYLLTITNDAWFGASIGPWQHFQMARMRALELGKPLLRAANTGITSIIGAKGEVIEQIPQFEANVLTAQIQPTKGETLFAKTGNRLIYALSLFCFIFAFVRNRKK